MKKLIAFLIGALIVLVVVQSVQANQLRQTFSVTKVGSQNPSWNVDGYQLLKVRYADQEWLVLRSRNSMTILK